MTTKPPSNRYQHKELIGSRVQLRDGRWGKVVHAGYGMIMIVFDDGHWFSGSERDLNENQKTTPNT
jgi:hypothetical protein